MEALTLELLACSVHGPNMFPQSGEREEALQQKVAVVCSGQTWVSRLKAKGRDGSQQ